MWCNGHSRVCRANAVVFRTFPPPRHAQVSLIVDDLCHAFFVDKNIRCTPDIISAISRTVPAAQGRALYQLHVQAYMRVLDLVARLQTPPPRRGTKRRRSGEGAHAAPSKRPRGASAVSLDPVQAEEEEDDDVSSDGTGEPEAQCAGLPEESQEGWRLGSTWEEGVKGECGGGGDASPSSTEGENPHPAAPPTPTPDVPVLPGGGGRVLKVSAAHLPFLVLLARLQYSAIQTLAGTSTPMV